MVAAVVAHASQNDGVSNSVTLNTVGANGITIVEASYGGASAFSDALGNSFSQRAQIGPTSGGFYLTVFDCLNPTTNSSHTILRGNPSPTYCSWEVLALSGIDTASGIGAVLTNTQALGNTNAQPGSQTPSINGCMIVNAIALTNGISSAVSIDSGLTIADQVPYSSGVRIGSALAYLIQAVAAAINPKWTYSGSTSEVPLLQFYYKPYVSAALAKKLAALGVG